jgi:hypothetical protein
LIEKADNPGGQVTDEKKSRARTTNRAVFFLLRPQADDITPAQEKTIRPRDIVAENFMKAGIIG